MKELELRHYERSLLFQMLMAQYKADFDTLIAEMTAKMEDHDIVSVKQHFKEWVKTQKQ